VQFSPLLCLTMCCCGYLRVLRWTLIACQTAGKRGERMQPGPACRTQTDHHAIDRGMLCSWCSANRPLSFTSMSAVARQSHVQATLACTTTVYPYSSPVSPDVDVCCVTGWQLMFEIMRTRCLSSGRHMSTVNIVLGVLPTKNIGPISIRPNMANIAQYPISQYQYRSNPKYRPFSAMSY